MDLASFEVPDLLSEESLDDSILQSALAADPAPVDYCIVPKATICGNVMLTDSEGYSYTRKIVKKGSSNTSVLSRCSFHNKSFTPAKQMLIRKMTYLFQNVISTQYPPKLGIVKALCIKKKLNLLHVLTSLHLQLKLQRRYWMKTLDS